MNKLMLIPVALVLAFACDAADEIEAEIDCQSICDRYAECFDDDYDVTACQDRCEDNIDSGEIEQNDVDECSDCIEDRSCTGATFACATECLSVVP
jgi:hypothetical protein